MMALDLGPAHYRWLDRVTKLGGVGLVAAGLEAGGHTPDGIALGALGCALALTTVFINKQ